MSKLLNYSGLTYFLTKIKGLLDTKAGTDLSNVSNENFANKMVASQLDEIYDATSSDGITYTATIPQISSLLAGLTITVRLSRNSASVSPTLNVNGLGAKMIRQPLSTNNVGTTSGLTTTWLSKTCPVVLTYTGAQWVTNFTRPSAGSIYGTVGIANGGTGANNATDALTNLGAASASYVNEQLASLEARISALENK